MDVPGSTQTGICKLCLRRGDLRDSHLIPRAVYVACREPHRKNPNPVLITREIVAQMSEQISDYLLCGECEQRFNACGEHWVLARMARNGQSPLYDALSALRPDSVYGNDRLYATAGNSTIDTGKLVYFAMSIFWRAAAHEWKCLGQRMGIHLGPYREPLRRWLVGDGPFPAKMAILICVPPTEFAVAATYGPRQMKNAHFHRISLYIPGIEFTLVVGNQIPRNVQETCAHSSKEKFIFSSPDVLRNTKEAAFEVRKTSRVGRNLQKALREAKSR
jgi:hypothetical protein